MLTVQTRSLGTALLAILFEVPVKKYLATKITDDNGVDLITNAEIDDSRVHLVANMLVAELNRRALA